MDIIEKTYQEIMNYADKYRRESVDADPLRDVFLYDKYDNLSRAAFNRLERFEQIELCAKSDMIYEHFSDALTAEEKSAVALMR